MRTITGTVYSGWNQEPIEGAHIILEINVDGDYYPIGDGTTTDSDGYYSFTFIPGGMDSERLRITHISHYDGTVYPHLVTEQGRISTLESKTHQVESPIITTWVGRNSNYLWSMTFLLLLLFVIIHETNGSIKWPWR